MLKLSILILQHFNVKLNVYRYFIYFEHVYYFLRNIVLYYHFLFEAVLNFVKSTHVDDCYEFD